MLALCSAGAWQSLPSVPGRSSKRIVNSLVVGMVGTSFGVPAGWAGKVLRDPTMSRILLRRPACIKGETKSLYCLSYTQFVVEAVANLDDWGLRRAGEAIPCPSVLKRPGPAARVRSTDVGCPKANGIRSGRRDSPPRSTRRGRKTAGTGHIGPARQEG